MHFSVIAALLGLLLVIFSVTMLVPIAFALWYNEPTVDIFLTAFTLTACSSALLWLPNKNKATLYERETAS